MNNVNYANDKYECFVFECVLCKERVYINKRNRIMKIFETKCPKCNSGLGYWYFIGEGNLDTRSVNKPVIVNRSDVNGYIEDAISKKYKH